MKAHKILLLIFLLAAQASFAQKKGKYDLRFVTKSINCTTNKVQIELQIKASRADSTFYLSDANFRFSYDPAVISFAAKTIVSQDAFSSAAPSNDNGYGAMTTQGSGESGSSGVVSLNITYTGTAPATPPKLVNENFQKIAVLEFDLKANTPTTCYRLTWFNSLSTPSTTIGAYDITDPDPSTRYYEATEWNLERLNECITIQTPTATATPSTVNAGGTVNLSANSPTTRTGNYVWSGPSGFSSTLKTPVLTSVTTNAQGVYSVNFQSNGCISDFGTTSLSVIPTSTPAPTCSPAVMATVGSNSPITAGSALNLSSSTNTTGGMYVWSGPNGFASTLANPIVANATTAATGTYSVRYDVGTTCTGLVSTINVVVNAPAPTCSPAVMATVGSNSPITAGASLNLSSSTTSTGGMYMWSGPNGFSSTLANPIVANAATGTYSVRYDVGTTCTGLVSTINVVVNAPIITIPPTSTVSTPTTSVDKPDLNVSVKVSNKNPNLGDQIDYTITIQNTGGIAATGIELKALLPTNYVQFLASNYSFYSPITGIWAAPNINPNASITMVISVRVIQPGVAYLQAEITKQNEIDFDSTPNNQNDREDDLDRVCFSVPVALCTGDQIEMNIPSQYTNIVWYKNGTKLAETGNKLLITEAGSYSYTATNNTCPTEGCCPLVVTYSDCCEVKCIPFVIKRTR